MILRGRNCLLRGRYVRTTRALLQLSICKSARGSAKKRVAAILYSSPALSSRWIPRAIFTISPGVGNTVAAWVITGGPGKGRGRREGGREGGGREARRRVTGQFAECVPRNAYRGNHTCVTRDRRARISSSYYRPCVRLHCCTCCGCNCVAAASRQGRRYRIARPSVMNMERGHAAASPPLSPPSGFSFCLPRTKGGWEEGGGRGCRISSAIELRARGQRYHFRDRPTVWKGASLIVLIAYCIRARARVSRYASNGALCLEARAASFEIARACECVAARRRSIGFTTREKRRSSVRAE